jgi:hydrogenase expression/formation protein HypC
MCLGVPARILEKNEDAAVVELGGVRREVSLMLLDDISVGEWVIVHAGFAIEKLSEEEAEQTLVLLREIADADEIH